MFFTFKISFIKKKTVLITSITILRTYYFYNDMINLENFDSNLLKIDKKHYKGINIYYIGYITIKKIDDCENIHSVNPLYLLLNHANKYIEEKMELNI